MKKLILTRSQKLHLKRHLKKISNIGVYKRAMAILDAASDCKIIDIARHYQVTRQSVYNWIKIFQSTGKISSLYDKRGEGRPSLFNSEIYDLLKKALSFPPDHWGLRTVNWTTSCLKQFLKDKSGLNVSKKTIRRWLKKIGYVWKRPRYVLAPDPKISKKKDNSQNNRGSFIENCRFV